jgi:hypothetical protein
MNMSANNAGREQNNAFVCHRRVGENIPWGVICIRVHLSVRVICARAFLQHKLLMSVELHDGIEVIEEEALWECTSLCKILIPPSVSAIKDKAFCECLGLTTAILNDGLEEIGEWAFSRCTSLVHIATPPSVRAIKDGAFSYCSGLTTAILDYGLEEIGEWSFAICLCPPSHRSCHH